MIHITQTKRSLYSYNQQYVLTMTGFDLNNLREALQVVNNKNNKTFTDRRCGWARWVRDLLKAISIKPKAATRGRKPYKEIN